MRLTGRGRPSASVPVAGNDLGGRQSSIRCIGCREGVMKLRLQPLERCPIRALLVAPNEITDILADVLVSPLLAHLFIQNSLRAPLIRIVIVVVRGTPSFPVRRFPIGRHHNPSCRGKQLDIDRMRAVRRSAPQCLARAPSPPACIRPSVRRNGAPERTRTSDLVLRRHALYPTELRALTGCL